MTGVAPLDLEAAHRACDARARSATPHRPRFGAVRASLTALALALAPLAAQAQALERHEAPGLAPPLAPRVSEAPLAASRDARPIGPPLRALALIGLGEAPPQAAAPGVDLGAAAPAVRRPLGRALRGFVGRPISRALISDVETAIVRAYRRAGRPFVSVTVPPQEISGGTLAVRVIAFRLGRVAATGGKARQRAAALAALRARPGEPVDAPRLEQDLAWLGRSPFETVQATFSPGTSAGETDLTLHVADAARPWSVSAGYADDGTPSSGIGRWTLGAEAGGLVVPGSLVSWQLTASDDVFDAGGHPFGGLPHPRYLSQSLVAAEPLAPRVDLTLSADYIESDTAGGAFSGGQQTAEASARLASALSNVVALPGEVFAGAEARWQRSAAFFGPFRIRNDAAVVVQALAGWRIDLSAPGAQQTLTLTARVSPGGLFAADADAAYAALSQGRVRRAAYAYGDLDYSGVFTLPGGWRYVGSLDVQVADAPLVDTEQLPIGGEAGARTYVYDDGGYDDGAILRSELHAPAFLASPAALSPQVLLGPFAFADLARAWDLGAGPAQSAASVGGGFDIAAGPHASGRIAAGWSLVDAPLTRAGGFKLLAQLRATY